MGKIKGQFQYQKFIERQPLTRKEAVLAQCYICNGLEEGGEDCLGGINCPLYAFFPYRGKKIRPSQDKRSLSPESGSSMASQGKEIAGAGALVA